jgi:hypothetical protein
MHKAKLRLSPLVVCVLVACRFTLPVAAAGANVALSAAAGAEVKNLATADLKARFAYLSTHGNSTCAQEFMASIASMPAGARLKGSCCAPMVLQRYDQQVGGLKKYANIPEIPADPYDIAAGLAKKMMAAYDMKLTPAEQEAYDYAMRLQMLTFDLARARSKMNSVLGNHQAPGTGDGSAHGSPSDRNSPPASTMRLTMANRSEVERAKRSGRRWRPRYRRRGPVNHPSPLYHAPAREMRAGPIRRHDTTAPLRPRFGQQINCPAARHRAVSIADRSGTASRSRDRGSCPPRPY